MAIVFSLFGRMFFVFLLGAGAGYALMAELLERAIPEAKENKKLIRYREVFMIAVIVLAVVCMCLIIFT